MWWHPMRNSKKKGFVLAVAAIIILLLTFLVWVLRAAQSRSAAETKAKLVEGTELIWLTPHYIKPTSVDAVNSALEQKGFQASIQIVQLPAENYVAEVKEYLKTDRADILSLGITQWGALGDRTVLEKENYILPLNDYLKEDTSQALIDAYPQAIWESCSIGDHVYWIPSGGNIPNINAAIINSRWAPETPMPETLTQEALLNYLVANKDYFASNGLFAISTPYFMLTRLPGYTYACSPFVPLVVSEQNSDYAVSCLLESADFQAIYSALGKLDKAGLIAREPKDLEETFVQINNYTTEADLKASLSLDENQEVVLLTSPYVYPPELLGACVGVATNSQHPELAFDVIKELYSNSEMTNYLAYGQEGIDYKLVNGRPVKIEDETYINPRVCFGNQFISYPTLYQGRDKSESYRNAFDRMPRSCLFGFQFDGQDVKNDIQRITEVMFEFNLHIANDENAFSQPLDEWNRRLEEAGLNRIQKELENQLNAWLSSS